MSTPPPPEHHPPPRDALERKGPQRLPQRLPQSGLHRRLEEGAKAVGGRYCRLQMPLKLALGVRETVAGQRLGALEGGGGGGVRPQRPAESSDPTQHAKGRTGDCPRPRKETTTRRNVTQGGGVQGGTSPPLQCIPAPHGGDPDFRSGKNEIYRRRNRIAPVLVHNLLGSGAPAHLLSSNTRVTRPPLECACLRAGPRTAQCPGGTPAAAVAGVARAMDHRRMVLRMPPCRRRTAFL